MSETFLVAVDDSPASDKAVDYLIRLTASLSGVEVHLMHVLSPTDPALLGLGKGPLRGERRQFEEASKDVRKLLEGVRDRLVDAGLPSESVDLGFLANSPDASMVDGLLDLARERDCETIVVGRHSLPWYREVFHHHPADELVRKGTGATIWVVE